MDSKRSINGIEEIRTKEWKSGRVEEWKSGRVEVEWHTTANKSDNTITTSTMVGG